MTQALPFIMQGKNIIVVVNNKPHTINPTHIAYEKIKDAIKASDWDTVIDNIEPKKVILNYAEGNISIEGELLKWKGKVLHGAMAQRVIQMYQEGFPIAPMVKFIENLMQNPSKRAVDELYGFLEKNNLPITDDGYFLAYKKVRGNYLDVYSGTMDNSVGQYVTMPRNEVNDDKEQTCSAGLHFCSIDYLNHFGGERIVIVKINPKDVVSIPVDYNNAKGRACGYLVVGEVEDTRAPEKAFTTAVDTRFKQTAPVAKPVAPVSGLRQVNGRWVRANGTFASRAEIQAAQNASTQGLKQDKNGQWRDAKGRFVKR